MEAKVNARNDKSQYHLTYVLHGELCTGATLPTLRHLDREKKLTLGKCPSPTCLEGDANYPNSALPLSRDGHACMHRGLSRLACTKFRRYKTTSWLQIDMTERPSAKSSRPRARQLLEQERN